MLYSPRRQQPRHNGGAERRMASTEFTEIGAILQRLEERSAMVVLDEHGVVRAWSPEVEALFGYSAAEAIGTACADLVIPEPLRPRHAQGLKTWQETGRSKVVCKRLATVGQHKDGHTFPVHVTVQVIGEAETVRFLGWITTRMTSTD
jgi:PAS domain S-box-containing protein